jgi:hypothetical protein
MNREKPSTPDSLGAAHGSATYDPKACCGSDCWAFGEGKGQCWGKVEVIDSMGDDPDGGELWVHACQGHKEMWQDYGNGGPELYVSEPQSPNSMIAPPA